MNKYKDYVVLITKGRNKGQYVYVVNGFFFSTTNLRKALLFSTLETAELFCEKYKDDYDGTKAVLIETTIEVLENGAQGE
jgi:hypothetical protein